MAAPRVSFSGKEMEVAEGGPERYARPFPRRWNAAATTTRRGVRSCDDTLLRSPATGSG